MNTDELKLPPNSIEAEQSVLGGLLIQNEAMDRITDVLSAADFYRFDHKIIFEQISKLIETNEPADIVTVAESLDTIGKLSDTGGITYLGALVQNTPGAANIRRYAEIVREKSVRRSLLTIASELQSSCHAVGGDAETLALAAEESIFQLFQKQNGYDQQLNEAVDNVMLEIDSRADLQSDFSGLATGFSKFDSFTGGLEPGQLVIVAARPSVGKSVFACNVADHIAGAGKSVLFHTLEMSSKEIGMRILSARSGVSMHQMRSGTRENNHWDAMTKAKKEILKSKLFIDDRPAIAVNQIRAKAKRIRRQHGLDLVVIDYLGLMTGKGDNRTQEIGSISRGLKNLAKELNVPIIALAQLNRGVEARQDKRPIMSDLRDSGEVEQDADIVLMLHREEIYNDSDEFIGIVEALLRKNRNGPTGDMDLRFEKEISKLTDYTGPRIRSRSTSPFRKKHSGFDQ
jgi:replicative DNA helicase